MAENKNLSCSIWGFDQTRTKGNDHVVRLKKDFQGTKQHDMIKSFVKEFEKRQCLKQILLYKTEDIDQVNKKRRK